MPSRVTCPYCKTEQESNFDPDFFDDPCHVIDFYDTHQDDPIEDAFINMQCSACHKQFVYTTRVQLVHTAQQADCLNGSEHQWEPHHKGLGCFTGRYYPDAKICPVCHTYEIGKYTGPEREYKLDSSLIQSFSEEVQKYRAHSVVSKLRSNIKTEE